MNILYNLLVVLNSKFSIIIGVISFVKTILKSNAENEINSAITPFLYPIKKRIDVRRGRDLFFDLCNDSFKLLNDNGILGVITCAYYLSLQDLIEVTRMAASRNGKKLEVIGINYQPSDHPWILHVPETLYLKALWVRVTD